jgi:DNA-binding NarL/FixJ family response regulator
MVVGTGKNHVHSILQKLDASSLHEAAAYLTILE